MAPTKKGFEPDDLLTGLFLLLVLDDDVDDARAIVDMYRDACRRGDVLRAVRYDRVMRSFVGDHYAEQAAG